MARKDADLNRQIAQAVREAGKAAREQKAKEPERFRQEEVLSASRRRVYLDRIARGQLNTLLRLQNARYRG